MSLITQDIIELIRRKFKEDELIKKYYEKERESYSKDLKMEALKIYQECGGISSPLLVRRLKISFKTAQKLRDWALKQPIEKIKHNGKTQMDKSEVKRFLMSLGIEDELIKEHIDEVVYRLNDKNTLKKIKIFEQVEGMIISIFQHLNIDRHQCLQILMKMVANQTSDFEERNFDRYLNVLKAQWKINSKLNEI